MTLHGTPKSGKGKRKASIGRPKCERVRDHWVSFRVTAEEHAALMLKAERSGMTAGEYARSRSMRGIARSKKSPSEPVELFGADTRMLLHELRKQGTNLNQLAHHCNRFQVPPPPEISELASVLRTLWDRLVPP